MGQSRTIRPRWCENRTPASRCQYRLGSFSNCRDFACSALSQGECTKPPERAASVRANVDDILTIPLLGNQKLTAKDIQMNWTTIPKVFLAGRSSLDWPRSRLSWKCRHNDVGYRKTGAILQPTMIRQPVTYTVLAREAQVRKPWRMAAVVDEQTCGSATKQMAPDLKTAQVFSSVLPLVFEGCAQPEWRLRTEPVLHAGDWSWKGTAQPTQKRCTLFEPSPRCRANLARSFLAFWVCGWSSEERC